MTGATSKFERVIHATAAEMLARFERTRGANHRASKGTLREEIVLEALLRRYLPKSVAVIGSSEIVSVDGQVSPQCDILIVDPNAPFFVEEEGYRIVPAEAVYGVIEVKSNLTSDELSDARSKIEQVKRMPRTAYRQGPGWSRTVYGKEWSNFPPFGMVFGFHGAELTTLGTRMADMLEGGDIPPELRVDSTWVMNRGSLTWADPDTRRINPAPNPGDAFQAIRSEPGQVLLQMIAHLHEFIQSAYTPGLDILAYYGEANFGYHVQAWVPEFTEGE